MKKKVQHHFGWLLLPVYFILHGWQYYTEILTLRDVAEAISIAVWVMCLLWFSSFLLVNKNEKHSLFTLAVGNFLFFTSTIITAIDGRRFLPKMEQQVVAILIVLFLLLLLLRYIMCLKRILLYTSLHLIK